MGKMAGVGGGEWRGCLTPLCNSDALDYRLDWSLAKYTLRPGLWFVVPMELGDEGMRGQTRLFIKDRRLGGEALESAPFEVPSDLFQPITVCFSSQDHM